MSRLNFAPIAEAFYLGSDQIKDTQAEILKLKSIISDSALSKNKSLSDNDVSKKPSVSEYKEDKRVGYSDTVSAKFNKDTVSDMDFLKIMQHPKFEDIVKNYIIVKYPELVNKNFYSTEYTPNRLNEKSNEKSSDKSNVKQTFGNSYSTTVCSNVTNYLLFFAFTMIIYLLLQKIFNKE